MNYGCVELVTILVTTWGKIVGCKWMTYDFLWEQKSHLCVPSNLQTLIGVVMHLACPSGSFQKNWGSQKGARNMFIRTAPRLKIAKQKEMKLNEWKVTKKGRSHMKTSECWCLVRWPWMGVALMCLISWRQWLWTWWPEESYFVLLIFNDLSLGQGKILISPEYAHKT